ncbi:glycoside hydrolase family 3 protein [Actinoplanes sp. NPDC051494]|uniref:glycoside hydrolase family 3 protein n=1 Tax=Actinoplanes sp. NPDC051494 TaxID=3363907 RepID=UPI0037B38919
MPDDSGLRRLALGTLLAAFPGGVAPDWIAGLLTDGLAGVTLFATNIDDPDQTRRLTATLRSAHPRALVALDEEGGDVTRLAHRTGSPYPGNAALGAVDDRDLTRSVYESIGADLAAVGVNLDLAPVADVNTTDDNPVIGTRSFGADPALVARHTAAAVAGLQSVGVAACTKHFPGHGATHTDSHLDLPTVDATLPLLRDRDLPPFAAAIEAGTRAIMTAHIRIPALTGTAPATFSREAIQDLLRHRYGFPGAIITDALEMSAALIAAGSLGEAAVRSLVAGADLLCLGARATPDLVDHVLTEIIAAVGRGELTTARLEEAAGRTAELASWPSPVTTPAVSREVGHVAARRALRIEGSVAGLTNPLVVELHAGHTIVEGRVPWGLAAAAHPSPAVSGILWLRVPVGRTTASELAERAGPRPIVLVGRRLHRTEETRNLVSDLAARHNVAVVEMGWPSAWRPAGVRAFLTTYGAGHANGLAAAEALGLTPPASGARPTTPS